MNRWFKDPLITFAQVLGQKGYDHRVDRFTVDYLVFAAAANRKHLFRCIQIPTYQLKIHLQTNQVINH